MSDSKISSVVQQIASATHTILSSNSDSVQSYANQLQQCRHMRQNLEQLDDQILHLTQSYLSAMLELQKGQYVNEELKGLAEGMNSVGQMAEGLSHHLRMRHVNYINERARQITVAMNEALGA